MDDRLLAFIGVSIAVVVIPGPDMALVARNVVRHGRSAGFATSVGICTGILGWAIGAGLGVSTILATSATAFLALKFAGAAYLIYLGIATLRAGDATGFDDGTGVYRRCHGTGRGYKACCRPCSIRSSVSSS